MKAVKTINATSQNQKAGPRSRLTSLRPLLKIVLTTSQVVGFIATLACLILTGPSVWTLLVGVGVAIVTKYNLVMMDSPPDLGDDTEALAELAEYVVNGHNRRG